MEACMIVLFLEWQSIGNEDVKDAFRNLKSEGMDIECYSYDFDNHIDDDNKDYEKKLIGEIKKRSPDFVFSFNYFPIASKACNEVGVKYVSWVYDNPAIRLYSYTLINKCNYVFVFDSQMYETFASQGIKNVFYLPMASAVERYDNVVLSDKERKKYSSQISFVGSLYSEDHNYYDEMKKKLPEYTKGYLEGIIRAQMEIDGLNIVEQSLTSQIIDDMVDALGAKPGYDSVASYEYLYSNYVINRKITSLERTEIISMLGEKYELYLYTKEKSFSPGKIKNKGEVDYYREMPYVFKCSDINLNITLRSIQKGIPLRIMDIFGCGGFLITNYQEDLLRFFVPGEDYVYYESREDLTDKIDYYIEHVDERKRIAESAYSKVKRDHTYKHRLKEIITVVIDK